LGDPYNALINIEAEYAGLHAPTYNFISEYVVDGDIKTDFRSISLILLEKLRIIQIVKFALFN